MKHIANGLLIGLLITMSGCFETNQSRLRGIIFINEFMAANTSTVVDERGDYDDWIEIYNAGDSAISLGGMYLTDNYLSPSKWRIPDTVIKPGEFLVIWADKEPTEGPLHTNFKLSAQDGEEIGLYDTEATGYEVIDAIRFPAQASDKSFGRSPDGEETWKVLADPTPGQANGSGE